MIRRRHWKLKKRYDPDAKFVWVRPYRWDGVMPAPGDPIPESLFLNKNKLRNFWESGVIEMEGFQAPNVLTGRPDVPVAPTVATQSLVDDYNEMAKRARSLGFKGRNVAKAVLFAFLAEHDRDAA